MATDPEAEFWKEDAERLNLMGQLARMHGMTVKVEAEDKVSSTTGSPFTANSDCHCNGACDKCKKAEQGLTENPFVSEAQRKACYAQDDPNWDCEEWGSATGDKKLPEKKKTENANPRGCNQHKACDTGAIKASADKVAKIQAKVDQAKAKLDDLKGQLKTAKANLSTIKAIVKSQATAKGPTKADAAAKEAASKIKDLGAKHIAIYKSQGKTPGKGVLEEAATAILGKTSPHKVAKELGMVSKFKNSEAARKAVIRHAVDRVGSTARVDA